MAGLGSGRPSNSALCTVGKIFANIKGGVLEPASSTVVNQANVLDLFGGDRLQIKT